jgi:hypothetical protein
MAVTTILTVAALVTTAYAAYSPLPATPTPKQHRAGANDVARDPAAPQWSTPVLTSALIVLGAQQGE